MAIANDPDADLIARKAKEWPATKVMLGIAIGIFLVIFAVCGTVFCLAYYELTKPGATQYL